MNTGRELTAQCQVENAGNNGASHESRERYNLISYNYSTGHTSRSKLRNGGTYRAFDVSYVDAVWSERVVGRPRSRVEAARARRTPARAKPAALVVVHALPAPVVAHGAMPAVRVALAGERRRWRCRNRWCRASPCTEEREEAVPLKAGSPLRRIVGRRLAAPEDRA